MVGASRGLSEAMVGVPSSRPGLPSIGPGDAVSVEATCSPSPFLRVGSPAFVLVDTTFIRITGEPDLIHS